ncbi:hypothetical protein OG539_15820 [Actinacidiphila glaucinigra]|uniref:hypothetical protein n=1 Tax=Actinacidiphila glaucinigra TaxID=235986 RepID=UPI002DDAEADA|nr:hypothetical protein [Actinacidiphila glaucinigra]WSD62252.1 hypothetical protein OIE69_26915 [Actinacidiphila glaucinigra]
MSPDGRPSSPRRFRRYGRLTGVVLPLAVAAAAVSAPVLATTPGTVTTAAGTRAAVNDPRPPVTRSVAADDDEDEGEEGEDGGREQEARDENGADGGDGGERTDQRGERETDRGDNGPDEVENERGDEGRDQGDQGRDDRGDQGRDQGGNQRGDQGRDQGGNQRGDQGGDQGGNQRGDQGGNQGGDQGGNQGGNQRGDQGGNQGGNRDDGRRDEQGDARGGREGDCVSIDSTLRKNDQEISVAVFEGRIFIGGRTLPRGRFVWHSLSGNRGYPRGVCGATVTSVGSGVWVKAITRDGRVVETHCTIHETRGKQSSCGEWKTLESRSFRSAR